MIQMEYESLNEEKKEGGADSPCALIRSKALKVLRKDDQPLKTYTDWSSNGDGFAACSVVQHEEYHGDKTKKKKKHLEIDFTSRQAALVADSEKSSAYRVAVGSENDKDDFKRVHPGFSQMIHNLDFIASPSSLTSSSCSSSSAGFPSPSSSSSSSSDSSFPLQRVKLPFSTSLDNGRFSPMSLGSRVEIFQDINRDAILESLVASPRPASPLSSNFTTNSNRSCPASDVQSTQQLHNPSDLLSYPLQFGKKGMTRQERRRYRNSRLPSKTPGISEDNDKDCRSAANNCVYVLLLEPVLRLFEIVKVEYSAETTIDDVLLQARTVAADPRLACCKYRSLCNGSENIGSMQFPVQWLVQTMERERETITKIECQNSIEKNMLVAVPFGLKVDQVRKLCQNLMKNPRMQRWLQQESPFTRKRGKTQRSHRINQHRCPIKSITTTTSMQMKKPDEESTVHNQKNEEGIKECR